MERKQQGNVINVLMFPWLAHGHISPFLELAKKLARRNFRIYLCSTPINLNSIKQNISPTYSLSIHLVELHLPSLPDLPPQCHTTNGLPPHLMETLKKAFDMAIPSFSNILETLRPDLLIYDFIQPWAATLALSFNIPAVFFLCTSVVMNIICEHFPRSSRDNFPFPNILPKGYLETKVLHLLKSSSSEQNDESRILQSFSLSSQVVLAKTFTELEGKYINYLSVRLMKKIVPVGPLVQEDSITIQEDKNIEVIQWLKQKENASTVFASFGSEYFLSKEEREEIAYGLELSNVDFIWVVRFPVGEKIKLEDALPKGYLERVKEKGLVVEGWLPQAKILEHSSIGGFVSHCGWSSIMESMKFGVPIIAMPMHLDQPVNAKLVEEVGVGIEVNRNDESGGRLDREEIGNTIRKIVVEKCGEDVRRKAKEMSDIIRRKGEDDIDDAALELVGICDIISNN